MSANSPNVTGISPAEGPPGTKVKIRGENLGRNAEDLLGVFICNVNCTYTAEWHPHYISCRTGMGLGNGSIVVVTKSGGKGASTVKFRGYMPRVGLLTESAVWVDESKLFEEKQTSGLSVSRPLSPNFTGNDPLGVAPSETGAVIPPDKIDEMYPKSSGNPLSENFHPARFLLEKHLDTSFDALKSGFYHLESQDTRSYSGPASLVRSNLGTILESLDILADVQQCVCDDKQTSPGGSITEELRGILNNCNTVSNSMFKDILSRKDDADAKRNALNVLQRFRFLFNLQRNIERNIQQGDYEIVISDYNRAKALFQNSEVKSFQRALEKVDEQVGAFMVQLKEKLFDFPSVLEEQRRLIRYLTDLDCPGDPAWECIVNMQQWIKKLFMDCKDNHQKSETSGKLSPPSSLFVEVRANRSDPARHSSSSEFSSKHRRTPSDGGRQAYAKSVKKTHSGSSSLTNALPESIAPLGESSTPPGIQFLEELCELIVENIPDLWQLGKAYLSGEIGNKVTIVPESRATIAKHTKRFSEMIQEIIKLFCNLVNGVLRPNAIVSLKDVDRSKVGGWSKIENLVSYLPSCGRQISTAYETLKSLELPEDSVTLLSELATSVSEQCVKEILKSTMTGIKRLEKKESWALIYDENNTCISSLPSDFEKMICECVSFIKNFMVDTNIDDKEQHSGLRKHLTESIKKLIEAFMICLQNIVTREEQLEERTDRSSTSSQRESSSSMGADIALDKKFLISLSNCNYLSASVLPRIAERCSNCGFEELNEVTSIFSQKIDNFDGKIFDKYIEYRGEPLVGSIEQGMLLGEYRWEDDLPLLGVRPYLRELILSLVVIHDQVSAISTPFVSRIFQKVGGMLADEVQRIFDCYSKFSENGALQAYLEICVFEGCLKYNLQREAQDTLRKTRKGVPQPSDENQSKINDMVIDFNKEMFFQLSCFWPPEEVKRFAEEHGMLAEIEEKRSKSLGKKPEGPPKASRGQTDEVSGAPPKVARGQPSGPPKAPRGQAAGESPPKAPRGSANSGGAPNSGGPPKPGRNRDSIKSSNVISSKSKPKSLAEVAKPVKLADIAKEKTEDNPFLDDSDESGNPFLDDEPSNAKTPSTPFEEIGSPNPFLDEDNTSNPFLDDDEGQGDSSNPFLD